MATPALNAHEAQTHGQASKAVPEMATGFANGSGSRDLRPRSSETNHQLARALGWASLGIGLSALTRPSVVARAVGVPSGSSHALMRAVGVREVASGIGLLTQPDPSSWLWARIGGDALDLALLARALGNERANRGRVATATLVVVGLTALDAYATRNATAQHQSSSEDNGHPSFEEARVAAAITVNAPPAEVFTAWNGFSGLPRFMESFATISVIDERRSQWHASLPGGIPLSWDIFITDAVPEERIAWVTAEHSKLRGEGEVIFRPAPGDRGTEVLFSARFDPPGGELGGRLAGLLTDPLGLKLSNDLRRFKQLTELGEIVKSDDSVIKGPNAAQPVASNAG